MSEANRPPSATVPHTALSCPPDQSEPTLIYRPPSFFQTLDLNAIFPATAPLEVELGSGDGSFLVAYARLNPGCNFLGVERLLGRLRKISRKGLRAKLTNLRVIQIEAGYFLEYLLPAHCARAVHVYFPDPWPKRKHRKNRLVNPRFVDLAERVLSPSGTVHLRTDDADYFAQMKSVFGANPHFREAVLPAPLASVITDFEREFHQRGVPSLTVSYALVSG